jgi:hypothetical protein
MTPRNAYIHGYLTRQQFIDAQWRIAEAKLRFQERFPNAFSKGGPPPEDNLAIGTGQTSEGRSLESAVGSSKR